MLFLINSNAYIVVVIVVMEMWQHDVECLCSSKFYTSLLKSPTINLPTFLLLLSILISQMFVIYFSTPQIVFTTNYTSSHEYLSEAYPVRLRFECILFGWIRNAGSQILTHSAVKLEEAVLPNFPLLDTDICNIKMSLTRMWI